MTTDVLEQESRGPSGTRGVIDDDLRLYRAGAATGLVGAVFMLPLVALHPHLPPDDPAGVFDAVLGFSAWKALHLAIVPALLLLLGGFVAMARSLRGTEGSLWASSGLLVVLVMTPLSIVGQTIDGFGLQVIAEIVRGTPAEQRGGPLLAGLAVELVGLGIFVLVMILHFGVASLLYARAFWESAIYPKWLTIIQVLAGAAAIAAGIGTYFDGFNDFIYYYLFIPCAVLFLLWVAIASIALRRWSSRLVTT